jgi:hypothetical protein
MADTDQEVRLSAILRWLEQGKITTAQAAGKVRTLHFPVPEPHSVGARFTEHVKADAALPEHGSFAEISAAFAGGKIDHGQYKALAEAAHDAMAADGSV